MKKKKLSFSIKIMSELIDKVYRKEQLLDWERKSLTEKCSEFSFSNKSTLKTLFFVTLGLVIFGFLAPYIPPRRIYYDWNPPENFDEYKFRLTSYLFFVPTIPIFILFITNLRNKIDLKINKKLTANFIVTSVISLGTLKIIVMNGWRIFRIDTRQPYYTSIKKGDIISIKRTVTFRLIKYFVRDERIFILENNKGKIEDLVD